jgi:hypothetical protein
LQNLVAQVGGFINMFWLILLGVNFFHSHLIFIRDIVHEIFHIKFIKFETLRSLNVAKLSRIEPKLPQNSEDDEKGSTSNEGLFKKIDPGIRTNSKKMTIHDLEKLINSCEEKDNKQEVINLDLEFADFLNYYTGILGNPERNQKKALIKKGMEILKSNLDVKTLIQKFYEIEKLKVLLLDEDQLRLFDSLPKPELELIVRKNQFDVITKVLKRRVSGEKGIGIRRRSSKNGREDKKK